MAKPFKNLVEKMSPESRARIRQRTAEMHAEMVLQELRQAQQLTQQEIASRLHMNQAAVSKLEHQSDMYVSTLRRFVAALGGDLRIVAHFPQGDVVINQFEEIAQQDPAAGLPRQSVEEGTDSISTEEIEAVRRKRPR